MRERIIAWSGLLEVVPSGHAADQHSGTRIWAKRGVSRDTAQTLPADDLQSWSASRSCARNPGGASVSGSAARAARVRLVQCASVVLGLSDDRIARRVGVNCNEALRSLQPDSDSNG